VSATEHVEWERLLAVATGLQMLFSDATWGWEPTVTSSALQREGRVASRLQLHRNERAPAGPVERWPMSAVLDLLDRGLAADWAPVVRALLRDPHGEFACALERALRGTYLYGTSALFLTLIARLRGEREDPSAFPKPSEFVP
jgi:hypothetical protein